MEKGQSCPTKAWLPWQGEAPAPAPPPLGWGEATGSLDPSELQYSPPLLTPRTASRLPRSASSVMMCQWGPFFLPPSLQREGFVLLWSGQW